MWIWSLDWEDSLTEEKATHCSILAWKILWTEDWQAAVHRVAQIRTAFAVFHGFWIVVFCFHLSVGNFSISSLISSVTHWFFSSVLFSLHLFVCVCGFFFTVLKFVVDLWFHSIVVRKDTWYYFTLLKFTEACFVANMWSTLENVLCAHEKNACSAAFEWNAL